MYTNISIYPHEKFEKFDSPAEAFKFGEKLVDLDNVVTVDEVIPALQDPEAIRLTELKTWFIAWGGNEWIETDGNKFQHLRLKGDLQFEAIAISNKYGDKLLTEKYLGYGFGKSRPMLP